MLQGHVTRIIERKNVGMGQSRHDLDLAGRTAQHRAACPTPVAALLIATLRRCFRSSAR